MGVVYGLYSTRDGVVRYVGQTEYTAKKRRDLLVTKALDQEPGSLLDWIREEWRRGHEVDWWVLQEDIIPADLDMFEGYWIEQFSGLLNVKAPADPERPMTEVGRRVNEVIAGRLRGTQAPRGLGGE